MKNFKEIAEKCLHKKVKGHFVIHITNTITQYKESKLLRKNENGYFFESPFGIIGRTYYNDKGLDITNPRMFNILAFVED